MARVCLARENRVFLFLGCVAGGQRRAFFSAAVALVSFVSSYHAVV